MAPRVQSGVAEEVAREWRGRLELEERRCGLRIEIEAETMTLCTFMWPSYYHKCPCLKSMAW